MLTLAFGLSCAFTGAFFATVIIILFGVWSGARREAAEEIADEKAYGDCPAPPRHAGVWSGLMHPGRIEHCPLCAQLHPPRTNNASPWYRAGGEPSNRSLTNHEKGK